MNISRLRKSLTAILLLVFHLAYGQTERYRPALQVAIENDFFNINIRGTDRYYSDALQIGVKSQVIKPNILDRIMVIADSAFRMREIVFSQQIYTPHHIGNPNIQEGDYPYVGLLTASYANRSFNSSYGIYSNLTVGVQGPWACGKEVQLFIHEEIFKTNIPQGWKHQLPNDLALRYTLKFEKILWSKRRVNLLGNAELNLGTLQNNLKIGGTVSFGRKKGYFNPAYYLFKKDKKKTKRQVYLDINPYVMLVQSNSLLEGGFIHSPAGAWGTPKASYYHIDRSELERFVYGYSWTLTYSGKWCAISFSENFYSAEIKGLNGHIYGSLKLLLKL